MGRLGISLQTFYDTYTPRILHNHINGYWDHNNMYLQTAWEVARYQLVPQLNIHLAKKDHFKNLQDYNRFHWEKKPKAPPPLPNLTKPEERQNIKAQFDKKA